MRPLHALALAGLALGVGLGGGTLRSARPGGAPVPPAGRAAAAGASLESVWWASLESQSTAVFNLGPVLSTPDGDQRRWTLVVHLPGTPELLTLVPGLVACDDVRPVAASGELFSVELMPAAGHTWGTVQDETHLVTEVHGLH